MLPADFFAITLYSKQRKKNEMVISTQVNTMSTYPQMSFLALPAVSGSF